jgi:hypothetical protein
VLLEFRPKEGKRPRAGADERAAAWRVGVDDRELERLIEGTVPEDNEVDKPLLEEAPGRVVAGIIPVDALGRLIEEIEPEDELEIIRDREFGVDGLELWVDVVLAAAASVVELDIG